LVIENTLFKAGEPFLGHMPRFSTNSEEIHSHAHRNFEEENKVFKSSINVINYRIINAYYNYMINAEYNYYIFNKGFVQKCNKEEHLEVAGGVNYILLEKKIVKCFVCCRVFALSLIGCHPNDKYPAIALHHSRFV